MGNKSSNSHSANSVSHFLKVPYDCSHLKWGFYTGQNKHILLFNDYVLFNLD